jgi:hypothetical protein
MSRSAIHRLLIVGIGFMIFFAGCRMCQMPNPYSKPTYTGRQGESAGGFLHRAGSLYSEGSATAVEGSCTECQAGTSTSRASLGPIPDQPTSTQRFRPTSRTSRMGAPFTREELMRGEQGAVDAKIISVEEGLAPSS